MIIKYVLKRYSHLPTLKLHSEEKNVFIISKIYEQNDFWGIKNKRTGLPLKVNTT